MSAIIMDGKKVAAEIEAEIKQAIIDEGLHPKLLIVTDGQDPASKVYIHNKVKAAERCGITPIVMSTEEMSPFDIVEYYPDFDGVIVQLPMQNKFDADYLIGEIPYKKDVDGLKVDSYHFGYFEPCTPLGIIRLLDYYDIPIAGRNAVVVGRSDLVGKPLARMLMDRDATVTVCHSKTDFLPSHTRHADIVISAVGKPNLITEDMVTPDVVVVDVGINRVDGKLCGDVDYDKVSKLASHITPVPGGVGPMTVAMLMENTLYAARMRKEEEEDDD